LTVTLRSIGDGVITTDREGTITLINKVAEDLTGWTEHAALGQPIDRVFHIVNERSHKRCENPVRRVIESGQIIGLANNTKLIRKDGKEFIIADSGAPIISKGGEVIGVVLVFRDITEKRRMHQEVLKVQKLESLGVLAGGIAHDFNNFLTGIIGNLSLVKLDITLQSKIYDSVKNLESAALRAKDLTQQLLTFSKGGKPVKSVVHLPNLVTESAAFALRGSNLKCHYAFKPDLEPVEVDEGQIGQVLNNLVINAVQATPQGGLITVGAENVVLGADNPMNLRPGQYVKLTLTDQGTGIPKGHIDRIFDPYFRRSKKAAVWGLRWHTRSSTSTMAALRWNRNGGPARRSTYF
jgi:PAS domain S-box-containing protein